MVLETELIVRYFGKVAPLAMSHLNAGSITHASHVLSRSLGESCACTRVYSIFILFPGKVACTAEALIPQDAWLSASSAPTQQDVEFSRDPCRCIPGSLR